MDNLEESLLEIALRYVDNTKEGNDLVSEVLVLFEINKVEYPVQILENQLKRDINTIWLIRRLVHPTMVLTLIEMAKELRGVIRFLKK